MAYRCGYGSNVRTGAVPVGPFPSGTDEADYDRLRRRVLWSLPAGLYILGSRARQRRNLMTLNWVMQVSLDPKLVAVSVERSAISHALIAEGRCYSVSLVARENSAVVRRFVKPPNHDLEAHTLGGIGYRDGPSGAPIPEIAVGYLDCELRQSLELGTHSLFVGEVVDAGFAPLGEGVPVLRMEDTRMSYGG